MIFCIENIENILWPGTSDTLKVDFLSRSLKTKMYESQIDVTLVIDVLEPF